MDNNKDIDEAGLPENIETIPEDTIRQFGGSESLLNQHFDEPNSLLNSNVILDALEKIKDISSEVPELMRNTLAVSIISSNIPEEGIDIATMTRMAVDYVSEGIKDFTPEHAQIIEDTKNMSDADIISKAQAVLEEKGMYDLAQKIGDGNLSREDAISGLGEYGYVINSRGENVDYSASKQIAKEMGGTEGSVLNHGLLLAENALDNAIIKASQELGEDLGRLETFNANARTPDDTSGYINEGITGPEQQIEPTAPVIEDPTLSTDPILK